MGLDNLKELLKATGTILGAVPVVGDTASAIVELTIQIMEIAEAPRDNKEACIELGDTAAAMTAAMARQVRDSPRAQGLEDKLQGLRAAMMEVNKCVAVVAHKSYRRRLLHWGQDKANIKKARGSLEKASRLFTFETAMHQETVSALLTGFVYQAQADARQAALISLHGSLKPLEAAAFNAHESHEPHRPPPGCLPGTRVHILSEIERWASDASSETVFWLSGVAGTGKTAIAYSVSELLDGSERRTLGASHFFKAGVDRRSERKYAIPSLAYQLARLMPDLCTQTNSAVSHNPSLPSATLDTQIDHLIARPLRAVQHADGRPIVIVLDALDECDAQGGDLLPKLASALAHLPHKFKLLVTSRPEVGVAEQLERTGIAFRALDLLHAPDADIASDIRLYLRHRLQAVADADAVLSAQFRGRAWPDAQAVETLVARARRLFLYAVVVAEYVSVPHFSPAERLDEIIRDTTAEQTPLGQLDAAYLKILTSSMPEARSGLATATQLELLGRRFRDVFGAVIHFKQSFPVSVLAFVLSVSEDDVHRTLRPLNRAVMMVPDIGSPAAVTFLHQSFPEYLQSVERCRDPRFFISKWSDDKVVQGWINKLEQALEIFTPETDDYDSALREATHISLGTSRSPTACVPEGEIRLEQTFADLGPSHFVYFHGRCKSGLVATKISRDYFIARDTRAFSVKEACAWKRLAHPNIAVPLMGISMSTMFSICVVTPWTSYGSIRDHLQKYPSRRRMPWLSDMCDGLHYLHTMGIVHGQIRGATVLIAQDERACLSGDTTLDAAMTRGYSTWTSLLFSDVALDGDPPESVSTSGQRSTPASDVYSLAMTWWEIYASMDEYDDQSSDIQKLTARPGRPETADPDGLSDGVWDLIQKCWAHDPLDRPNISSVKQSLRSILQNAGYKLPERL